MIIDEPKHYQKHATTRNPYIVLFGFVTVAEQIGVKGHDKLNGTSYINNADERTVLSVFRGNNDNVNTPEKYGLMVVYSALGYVNQTFYSSIYKGRIYQRFYGDSSWSSWQRIDSIQ